MRTDESFDIVDIAALVMAVSDCLVDLTPVAGPTIIQRKCNIVVLGKTGAGKSTVANSIAGTKLFGVRSSVKSVTRNVHDGMVKFVIEDTEYNIKLIDTVGLFDTGAISNNTIIQQLKEHFQNRVSDGVDLILFVFKEGRFTKEERATFDFIIKKFSDEISEISALVITNCDLKSETAREKIKTEFQSDPTTKPIADFVRKGIFVVGFPNLEEVEDEGIKACMQEKVERDREKLRSLVRTCEGEPKLARELFTDTFWERCRVL